VVKQDAAHSVTSESEQSGGQAEKAEKVDLA
jgi:hypothetical protein